MTEGETIFWTTQYGKKNVIIFLVFQSMYFFLMQSEQGDIFKVTLDTDEDIVSDKQQSMPGPFIWTFKYCGDLNIPPVI